MQKTSWRKMHAWRFLCIKNKLKKDTHVEFFMHKKQVEERYTRGVFSCKKRKLKRDAHVECSWMQKTSSSKMHMWSLFFCMQKKKQVEDRCAWSLLCIKKSVEDRYARGVFLCIQNKLKKDTHVELFMNKKTSRRKIHTWSFYA